MKYVGRSARPPQATTRRHRTVITLRVSWRGGQGVVRVGVAVALGAVRARHGEHAARALAHHALHRPRLGAAEL